MTGKNFPFFVRIRKNCQNKTSPEVSARGLKKIAPCSAAFFAVLQQNKQYYVSSSTGTAIIWRNSVAMSYCISTWRFFPSRRMSTHTKRTMRFLLHVMQFF